jgi:hypothetical protein
MNLVLGAFYGETVNYFQNNTYIGIALAGVLLLLLLRKPKLFFMIALIVAVNVASLYVISKISSVGLGKENKLVQQTSQHLTTY